ncbi:hypothetical protein SAMN04487765_1507 [Tenacibaculum sp. MAR_2010_89]|nr:hypothetical protein SAMN04487765_1507 [Tenacibaculum sp. MAR_2010_89]
MKKQILNLGKVLKKGEQISIKGGSVSCSTGNPPILTCSNHILWAYCGPGEVTYMGRC